MIWSERTFRAAWGYGYHHHYHDHDEHSVLRCISVVRFGGPFYAGHLSGGRFGAVPLCCAG